MSAAEVAAITEAIHVMHLVTCFDVAASTVFIWDYLITFSMEVDLVWTSKWNFMKVLYLCQRYMPFVDTVGLVLYHQLGRDLNKVDCQRIYYTSGVMIIVGIALSELILTLRTWAVWDRNARLTIILPILYAICWGPDFFFLVIFLRSLKFGDQPYPEFVGCFVINANHMLILCWVVLMVWDAVIFSLIMVPGLRAFRAGGNSALMKVVYPDGATYYLYLFFLSSVNIIVVKILPPQYQHLFTSMERCFHSMLTSRVLLHIRAHTSEHRVYSDGLTELNSVYQNDTQIALDALPRATVSRIT
ncbi:hypothetical protein BDZ97DRAFT_741517 [Flammula alnicola]|nr:hypothetical protein BDZ97DRAFT_741517 [Flammula alnicola]